MVTNTQGPNIACVHKLLMWTSVQVTMNVPKGLFCSAMQGCTHWVIKSGSGDVLTTAVTTIATSLATSLAAALQRGESSGASNHKNAGSSTPPQLKCGRGPVVSPVRAAQLKTNLYYTNTRASFTCRNWSFNHRAVRSATWFYPAENGQTLENGNCITVGTCTTIISLPPFSQLLISSPCKSHCIIILL